MGLLVCCFGVYEDGDPMNRSGASLRERFFCFGIVFFFVVRTLAWACLLKLRGTESRQLSTTTTTVVS